MMRIGKSVFQQKKLMKGFHWESNHFDLLGLTFSVNLDEMGNLNFESKMREIKSTSNKWQPHCVTPFGKVTVVETLIILKLNHLFLSLLDPDNSWIEKLESVLLTLFGQISLTKLIERL